MATAFLSDTDVKGPTEPDSCALTAESRDKTPTRNVDDDSIVARKYIYYLKKILSFRLPYRTVRALEVALDI
jgi:hypothetical protein